MMANSLDYTSAGVKVVLLLDPEAPFAAVFRENQLPQRFEPTDTLTLPEVLRVTSHAIGAAPEVAAKMRT